MFIFLGLYHVLRVEHFYNCLLSALIFNFSEHDMKSRINSLRTYYSKDLWKISQARKNGAGGKETHQSRWPHFACLPSYEILYDHGKHHCHVNSRA